MTALILRADARDLPLHDASIDLVVTSPPYWALRSYEDGGEHYDGQIGAEPTPAEYLDNLIACTREMVRVLKPTGSVWINLGDSYAGSSGSGGGCTLDGTRQQDRGGWHQRPRQAGVPRKSLLGVPWRFAIRCVDELSLILRAEVIWEKTNPVPESATDRVGRRHETWFHFTTNQRYYASIDPLREPASGYRRPNATGRSARGGQRPRKMLDTVNPAGRLPGSVWQIANQPRRVPAGLDLDVEHFAAFPLELPRRIITGWSPDGGTVLDPFAGTGTTLLAADILGRHGIGTDKSGDYCRLAAWRINDPSERAKALGVPKPPPVPETQTPLFDLTTA